MVMDSTAAFWEMKLQLGRVAWPKGRGAAIRQLFRSPEAAGVSGQGRRGGYGGGAVEGHERAGDAGEDSRE